MPCRSPFLRRVLAALLLVFPVGCLLMVYGTLKNPWGYQDSSTAFYIAVASVFLLFATLSAASGFLLLRR
jgi:hypothetical protein